MKPAIFTLLSTCCLLPNLSASEYEHPANYPLMGDWKGNWATSKMGPRSGDSDLTAQLLPIAGGKYRVVILPELYNRAAPYLSVEVPATHEQVEVRQGGWDVVFRGSEVRGKAVMRGDDREFVLKKVRLDAPTRGSKPPEDAIVLFDGGDYASWQHEDGKPVTWVIVEDAMQVVTKHDPKNREKGLGGGIETKKDFGSMRFHMEFRYPVEPDRSGQGKGNSGLIFPGIGEVQILNSYTTANYWDECGAIYKRVPAKVDAAGPPLEWQTYDVEIDLPAAGRGTATMTVLLNGRIIHNKMAIPSNRSRVKILLQDHVNIMQFRNIWLVEK